MFKPITLTGSVVSLALLSACAPSPAPLSLSERLPIAVDLVRQPNGDSRPRSDVIRAEAACELSAAAVRREAATMFIIASSRAPLMALDGSSSTIGRAEENAYLTCERSYGWERVATRAEADQIAAKARADRLAGR